MHGLYCILLDEIVDFPLHTAMKKLVMLNVNRTNYQRYIGFEVSKHFKS